jgi:hypothetical protein
VIRGFVASYSVPVFLLCILIWADTNGYVTLPYEIKMTKRNDGPFIGRDTASNATFPVKHEMTSGKDLLDKLKAGGNIVLVRHFQTAGTRSDLAFYGKFAETPLDYFENCNWQRMINKAGQYSAGRAGSAMTKLGVKWTAVYVSPFCRARESAKLLSGVEPKVIKELSLPLGEFKLNNMREFLFDFLKAQRVSAGQNILIVAHVFHGDAVGVGLEEGEAAVFQRTEDEFKLVGKVRAYEWPLALVKIDDLGFEQFATIKKIASKY